MRIDERKKQALKQEAACELRAWLYLAPFLAAVISIGLWGL